MDEKPRLWRYLLIVLSLFPALLLLVAAVVLLGLSYYVRAAVVALAGLFRILLGRKQSVPAATQPPHLFPAEVPTLDKRTVPPRDGG
jgi:hypothetical protein